MSTIVHCGVEIVVTHRMAMTGYRLVGSGVCENAGISPSGDRTQPWIAVCRREQLGYYATREEAERAALDALVGP